MKNLLTRAAARRLDQLPSLVVVRTSGGYWGKGADLKAAMLLARKYGATGTQEVLVTIYIGEQKYLDEININDGGSVFYDQHVTSHEVGTVRMPMSQGPRKRRK